MNEMFTPKGTLGFTLLSKNAFFCHFGQTITYRTTFCQLFANMKLWRAPAKKTNRKKSKRQPDLTRSHDNGKDSNIVLERMNKWCTVVVLLCM